MSARKVDSYAYFVLAKRTYWADPPEQRALLPERELDVDGAGRRVTRSCS